jgi:hypothetical protein
MRQVEKEAGLADGLRAGASETWPVLLQPPPKAAATTTAWRNATACKRTLILTTSHLLECHPDSCRVLWARELALIRVLKRWLEEPQRLTIEFADGHLATYDSPHRDLVAALIHASLSHPGPAAASPAAAALAAPAGDPLAAAGQPALGDSQDRTSSRSLAEMPRIGLVHAAASCRLLHPNAPASSCLAAEQIAVKRLAALAESGMLPGGDEEDIVNPMVVAAGADVCSNAFGCALACEGRDVETAVLSLVRQLQGRKVLDCSEPSDVLAMLECLRLLAGTKTAWSMLARAEGRREECRAGIASVLLGLASPNDEIVLASLAVLHALLAPPFAAGALVHAHAAAGEAKAPAEVHKHMEALREELLADDTCRALGRIVSGRARVADGGVGVLVVWEVLRVWQALVCEPANVFSSARLHAACTASWLSDNGAVTALLGHRCRPVAAAAWQVLQKMLDATVEEGFIQQLQQAALRDGSMLRHLHAAIFHPDVKQQALSRRMCGVWMEGNPDAAALLARCLPIGMVPLIPACAQHSLGGGGCDRAYPSLPPPSAPGAPAGQPAATSGMEGGGAREMRSAGAGSSLMALERTLRASPALAASLAAAQHGAHAQPACVDKGASMVTGPGGGVSVAGGEATAAEVHQAHAQHAQHAQQVRTRRCEGRAAWEGLLEALLQDHASVSRRWNARTRAEFRAALELEVSRFEAACKALLHDAVLLEEGAPRAPGAGAGTGGDLAWNHDEFCVEYTCLHAHLCIEGIFVHEALAALQSQEAEAESVLAMVADGWQFVLSLFRALLEGRSRPVQVGAVMEWVGESACRCWPRDHCAHVCTRGRFFRVLLKDGAVSQT